MPQAIKDHRPLARIYTTSSDVFCSEEDSCGLVNYVKLIANNECTTRDYWLLYEDVQFMVKWFTSNIWGEGNFGKLQLFNSITLIPSFISYTYGTLHINYNGDIFFFLRRVSYRSSHCGYELHVFVKTYRHFGEVIRIPWWWVPQLFINIHDLASE